MTTTIYPAADRGSTKLDWLDGRHTFSFGQFRDPYKKGFRALRVINDDHIKAGHGFREHGHEDMEIITLVLEGTLQHRDSLGNGSSLTAGQLQRMTAGSGIRHSEFNGSDSEPLHLYQIWIIPGEEGLRPSYQELDLAEMDTPNIEGGDGPLRLIGSPNANSAVENGPLRIHQDVKLYHGQLSAGDSPSLPLEAERYGWVQVIQGSITLNGQTLGEGDGAALEAESSPVVEASEAAQILFFDLA